MVLKINIQENGCYI